MPKLKTRKAASKRYKITGSESFLRRHAFKGHLLMKKSKRQKKRIFRRIWISRINASSKLNGISYSQLMHKFKKSNIDLNRKMLSQVAVLDASTFKSLVNL